MDDCLFCKIVAKEIPSNTVFEDEQTLAFLTIQPNNPGHTLVIPKKHFRNIFDIDEESIRAIGRTTQKVAQALMDSRLAEGINVISNNEKVAGQLVFHAHTHVIPRISTDGFKFWTHKEYRPGEAEVITDKIKKAL